MRASGSKSKSAFEPSAHPQRRCPTLVSHFSSKWDNEKVRGLGVCLRCLTCLT